MKPLGAENAAPVTLSAHSTDLQVPVQKDHVKESNISKPPVREVPPVASIADSAIGKKLNAHDAVLAREAEAEVLAHGGTKGWKNKDNGPSGEVTLVKSYKLGMKECRDLKHFVKVDEKNDLVNIHACRDQGGAWSS